VLHLCFLLQLIWVQLKGEGNRGYVRMVASPRNQPSLLNYHAFGYRDGSLLCQLGHIWIQHLAQLFG
jgi:hypothetical protein